LRLKRFESTDSLANFLNADAADNILKRASLLDLHADLKETLGAVGSAIEAMIYNVMGVEGSGKTTIAKMLAQRLGWVYLEADQFHSEANKEKMRRGIPLTDADRLPWLEAIHAELKRRDAAGENVIVACSALKEKYREVLSAGLPVRYFYLKGNYELIRSRLRARHGHFAGEAILANQFEVLEEPKEAVVADVAHTPEQIVAEVMEKIRQDMGQAQTPGVDVRDLLLKIRWKLLPFLFLLYVVAYLDRINVGFAALQMKGQLGFSDTVYGLGASIFFMGYFLFQVPSNLMLRRVGARRWIGMLMVVWGIISCAMLFIGSARMFYVLRFLLGAAEAGFFPGVIFYLRSWFPPSARAGVVALFMTAGPISGLIGGPISGFLLDWNHKASLAGWQWMFLMEGLPAIALGIVAYLFLSDSPEKARWLSGGERQQLLNALYVEESAQQTSITSTNHLWFFSPGLWGFAIVYFGLNTCTYGVSLWLPSALKSMSVYSNVMLGFVSAIPYLIAVVAMVLVGAHSDKKLERRWHIAISAGVGAMALLAAGYSTATWVSVAAFGLALAASSSMTGPFWAMASGTLAAATAAPAIALINAIGNLGSGFGPYWIGYLKDVTGSFRGGLVSVALLLFLAGLTVLRVDRKSTNAS
jgi:ACS family tartrate transporter-like MFS transporter